MGKSNWIDKTINVLSPKWGAEREAYRRQRDILASYDGALAGRRSTIWEGTMQPQSVWGMPQGDLRLMRDRARSLEKNNALADGILSRATENIVGTGFEVQVTTDDPEWNRQAEALLEGWYDTADITGLTWVEHQRLVVRSHLRDGDIGSILLSDGRLQPIEGDLIRNPSNLDTSKINIVDGVELNDYNRPIRFYVTAWNAHGDQKSSKIDATDFAFYPRLKRVSQIRGEPALAQSFELFDQIDGWKEATIVAARMAACFGLVIEKANAAQVVGKFGTTMNLDGNQQPSLGLEPGMMQYLEPGEKVSTVNPNQPTQNFPDALAAFIRLVGLPLGMPLELVLLDFSRGPFSANRAAMMQAYRSFKTMQTLFADRYLSRVHRWRISKFIKEGKLADRPDSWSHRVIAQPWPYLDPMREALALQQRIDGGMETLHGALQAEGHDYDTWLQVRSKEIEDMKAAGIPLMHGSAMVPFDKPGTTNNVLIGGE